MPMPEKHSMSIEPDCRGRTDCSEPAFEARSRSNQGIPASIAARRRGNEVVAILAGLAALVLVAEPCHALPIPIHGGTTHFDLLDPGVGPGPGILVPSTISPIFGFGFPPSVFFPPAVGTAVPAFDEPAPPAGRGPYTGCALGLAFYISPPGINVGGLACAFSDTLSSSDPWHWETKISSPAGSSFYVGWFVGSIPIASGVLSIAPGSVFYMDIDFHEATFGLSETKAGPFGFSAPPYFMAFANATGATLGFDGSVTEGTGFTPPGDFVPPGPVIPGTISPITGLPVTAGFLIDPPFIDMFILDPDVVPYLLPALSGGAELQVVTMRIPAPSSLLLVGLGLAGLLGARRSRRNPGSGSERAFR